MIITSPDRSLLLAQVARHAAKLSGEVLDVGAGRVRRYHALCTGAKRIRTIDTDPQSGADMLGSAEQIPVPPESVDSILCTQVLEHVRHPQRAVAEMYRVLRRGGRCLVTVPQTNELHEEPDDFFRYTKYGLETMFNEAGFVVESLDQRGKYHATVMQLRIRQLVNTWRPYESRGAMSVLCPLTWLLTRWALWRDRADKNPASALHAIGWCLVVVKP